MKNWGVGLEGMGQTPTRFFHQAEKKFKLHFHRLKLPEPDHYGNRLAQEPNSGISKNDYYNY